MIVVRRSSVLRINLRASNRSLKPQTRSIIVIKLKLIVAKLSKLWRLWQISHRSWLIGQLSDSADGFQSSSRRSCPWPWARKKSWFQWLNSCRLTRLCIQGSTPTTSSEDASSSPIKTGKVMTRWSKRLSRRTSRLPNQATRHSDKCSGWASSRFADQCSRTRLTWTIGIWWRNFSRTQWLRKRIQLFSHTKMHLQVWPKNRSWMRLVSSMRAN